MDQRTEDVRITFEGLTRADANRAAEGLRQAQVERLGGKLAASIEKGDPASRGAGRTPVVIFGSSSAVAIAQGIRAWLMQCGDDRDRITVNAADGTAIVATGEAARTLDAAALVRGRRGPS